MGQPVHPVTGEEGDWVFYPATGWVNNDAWQGPKTHYDTGEAIADFKTPEGRNPNWSVRLNDLMSVVGQGSGAGRTMWGDGGAGWSSAHPYWRTEEGRQWINLQALGNKGLPGIVQEMKAIEGMLSASNNSPNNSPAAQPNQPASQPNQPASQPNQPASEPIAPPQGLFSGFQNGIGRSGTWGSGHTQRITGSELRNLAQGAWDSVKPHAESWAQDNPEIYNQLQQTARDFQSDPGMFGQNSQDMRRALITALENKILG